MNVRVARVEELPPGRGKRLLVGGCELVVWNLEGRLQARAVAPRPHAPDETGCLGLTFDAQVEDSPAELAEAERHLPVAVAGDFVVVSLDEAAAS